MNSSRKVIELPPLGSPRTLPRADGFAVASVSVNLDGDAVRLLIEARWAGALIGRTKQPGWASFPKTHTEAKYSSLLTISGSSGSREIYLSDMTAAFPKIETLPENKILIVGSRCRRNQDGTHELNAQIYSSHGIKEQEFLLGDGIRHVQSDAKGNIWVGYFDEGVYGNFGWQYSGGPFGAAGLSCFSPSGQKMWDFEPPEGYEAISDCYALNVTKEGVWAYYYTDFPIALIDSEWGVRCWRVDSPGARTFAAGDGKVLLYGGYEDRRTACTFLKLGNVDSRITSEISLVLPSVVNLSKANVIGRGKELHVFHNDDWYVFSIDSLS